MLPNEREFMAGVFPEAREVLEIEEPVPVRELARPLETGQDQLWDAA